MSKINVGNIDECWEWQALKDKHGYGKFKLNDKMVKAHRFAWELVNGPIPEGMVIRHNCDNPGCVNSTHLEIGTQADNVKDMVNRGRQSRPKGTLNSMVKKTESDIIAIRSAIGTQTAIAKKYGISQRQVSNIKNRKQWKHL